MILSFLNRYREFGLLVLRVGLGVMFIIHGWPKMSGGPAGWTELGHAMANLGVTFQPMFWGFMAALAEFGGGICLVLGFATRLAAFLMAFNMVVATIHHLSAGDGLMVASHAIEDGVAFLSLIFLGAGRFSFDGK